MLGKTYKFKLSVTSYNTVKKGEGFTVTQVEEVIAANLNNAPPQPLDLNEQLGHDNAQNSKEHLENKQKSPEDAKDDKKSSGSSVTKESVAKQTRKRQK